MKPNTTCGWLIKGDPVRPCVLKPGHKGKNHVDEATREVERAASIRRGSRWREANRDHIAAYSSKWYMDNREARLSAQYVWNQENREARATHRHKRRALAASVPHVPWTKAQLLSLYGSRCWLCQQELGTDWHADHVIPISKGGWDMPLNLRPSCAACNLRKHTKLAGNLELVGSLITLMLAVHWWARVSLEH